MPGQAGFRQHGELDPAPEPSPATPSRKHLNPTSLGYLIGPIAFVAVLLLMRFHYVVHESAWIWLGVFIAIPVTNLAADHLHSTHPSPLSFHVQLVIKIASVTAAIYLTGWGPVLWGAYAFVALEVIAQSGSWAWRPVALWSLVAMGSGDLLIWLGWLPCTLSFARASAITLMGVFVLVFVIRMAGALIEQKEGAEAAVRLSEDRFRSLIQNSSDVTMIIGPDGLFRYLSPAVADLLGYEPAELVGSRATSHVHPDDAPMVQMQFGPEFQASSDTAVLEFRMIREDGTPRDVEAVVSNQIERQAVGGYVANVRDVTERKKFEDLLSHRALHDPLTGLANRQLILDRADRMLVRARRDGQPVAALFVDLDNFKDANDSLGHEAGDRLLQSVASRLVGLLRSSDTVGRLGGDEFVILAEGMSLADGPKAIADRIRQVLRPPFFVEGFESLPITVSASIGIAVGDRQTGQDLLRDADIALYRAKASGRDQSVVFQEAMHVAASDRLTLRTELDSALSAGEFRLLYQPIFDLEKLQMRGVEALIRWQHPSKGILTPDRFIHALEDAGDIVDVGRWVLDEACRQLAVWHSVGQDLTMSVNVSMRQLDSNEFVGDVRNALDTYGLAPSSLIIEITESVLMKDANATVSRLHRLKDLGVMLAIDDFGTGYSSLAYLRQFPVDVLKIDRTFVSEMSGSPDAAALIHTLVELGHTLGLVTLAEGIEQPSQIEGLRSERCQHGQGFLFSRPVIATEIEKLFVRAEPDGTLLNAGAQRLPRR
ncbi:MAG: EAL domain-containing protein [Acidimicrobiales bacterium]|jgi:diguanylate cyclase (GGDEF)-like protein/PAS domain S-box-containing protein